MTWPLVQDPGIYDRAASFGGNGAYGPSVASSAPFTLTKANTSLTLTLGAQTSTDSGIIATLKDGSNNVPLAERTVFLAITGPGGSQTKALITRADGSVTAGKLPPGSTSVKAYFLGVVPLVSTAENPVRCRLQRIGQRCGAGIRPHGPCPADHRLHGRQQAV